MFPVDRLNVEELKFKTLFTYFVKIKKIEITLHRRGFNLSKKDYLLAKKTNKNYLLKNLEFHRVNDCKELNDEEFNQLVKDYLKLSNSYAKTCLERAIIMMDTSIDVVSRFKKHIQVKSDIDFNEIKYHSLFDDCLLYSKNNIAIGLAKREPGTDFNDFLDKDLSILKPHVNQYKLMIEGANMIKPYVDISYSFKYDEFIKSLFIYLGDGDIIGLNKISFLDKDNNPIFIYDYDQLIYYYDFNWYDIGGILSN